MVVVQGKRIVAVGANVAVPAGSRVIDLGDATLLPGFIDAHVHLTDDYNANWSQGFYEGMLQWPGGMPPGDAFADEIRRRRNQDLRVRRRAVRIRSGRCAATYAGRTCRDHVRGARMGPKSRGARAWRPRREARGRSRCRLDRTRQLPATADVAADEAENRVPRAHAHDPDMGAGQGRHLSSEDRREGARCGGRARGDVPQRAEDRREDRLRHRCGGISARPQRAGVRRLRRSWHGTRYSADDQQPGCRKTARRRWRNRHARSRQVRRRRRGAGQRPAKHPRHRKDGAGDEAKELWCVEGSDAAGQGD